MQEQRPVTDEYLLDRFGELNPKELHQKKEAMEKYEKYWWESKDPIVVASHQIFENTPLVDLNSPIYLKGIGILCDRKVSPLELKANLDELRKQVRAGMERVRTGNLLSDETREHNHKLGIRKIKEYLSKRYKGLIFDFLDLTQNDSEVSHDPEIDASGYDGWLTRQ